MPLGARRRELPASRGVRNDLHALTAPAGAGLDEQWVAHAVRLLGDLEVGQAFRIEAGDDRNAVALHVLASAGLVAHDLQGVDGGTDEDDAALGTGLGQPDALGQEPVPGVDGLRTGAAGSGDHGIDVEIRLGRGRGADPHGLVRFTHVGGRGVGVAVDGDAADAERPEGADHAAGDLPAIGDENRVEGAGVRRRRCRQGHSTHIRKTPKRGSGSGLRETTSRARPRRSRVCSGSTMPSSQSRAVA